ncbi:hypothetical protein N7465_007386 [Penicillium sp. CMV-2018d]|nr:hypothetical protein N7465_007386 [Penicillium sp. CMV-2018d]
MAPTPYFSSITSESAFRARFQSDNGRAFSKLPTVAASHWDRSHLLACRVIRRESRRNVLPILSQHIYPSDVQDSTADEIKAFLRGPEPEFMTESEHYLVRGSNSGISLGQIWAAMATFKGSQDRRRRDLSDNPEKEYGESDGRIDERDGEAEPRPKRARGYTSQEDYVNSSTMQVGSSSPPHSGSHGTSSLDYVDSDSHILGIVPEDETFRLASCVIRHILYFAPPQNSTSEPTVVEFRDAKTRLAARTLAEKRQIVAIDDGGLCLRRREPGRGFLVVKNHVAILEAKTQFQCLEDGRPVISDGCFAQMVCEALAARLSDPENLQQRIPICELLALV